MALQIDSRQSTNTIDKFAVLKTEFPKLKIIDSEMWNKCLKLDFFKLQIQPKSGAEKHVVQKIDALNLTPTDSKVVALVQLPEKLTLNQLSTLSSMDEAGGDPAAKLSYKSPTSQEEDGDTCIQGDLFIVVSEEMKVEEFREKAASCSKQVSMDNFIPVLSHELLQAISGKNEFLFPSSTYLLLGENIASLRRIKGEIMMNFVPPKSRFQEDMVFRKVEVIKVDTKS